MRPINPEKVAIKSRVTPASLRAKYPPGVINRFVLCKLQGIGASLCYVNLLVADNRFVVM